MIATTPVVTKYIQPIVDMVRALHAAYPDDRVELRIVETEVNGWQCYIEFTEHGVKMASESFYINPPGTPA